jgi:hypothetical protein
MMITDPNILEYLHDASVSEVVYDCKDNNSRNVTLSVTCPTDTGYPAWDGKRLSIRLESIVLLSFSAFGAVTGKERINAWTTCVSEPIESELRRLQGLGIDCSGVRFAVTFQSGSVLEGLCQSITAEQS